MYSVRLLALASACLTLSSAFVVPRNTLSFASTLRSSSNDDFDDAFAAFEESIATEDRNGRNGAATAMKEEPTKTTSWQAKLETLLDPSTSLAQRQTLLSELLSANQEIRESVLLALSERKLDPLLTPTGKKLQDGTRAVARQLTTDILPNVLETPPPRPELFPKIGSQVLNAISNQAKKTLQEFQGDLANPARIPQRLSQQSLDLAKASKNIFLETPEGLQGPSYTVVASQSDEYEIRDYEGYTVASTTLGSVGEPYNMDDVASSGAAFNALAAYVFGGNADGALLQMTTPVTTTLGGEMRFYLKPREDGSDDFPEPINSSDDGTVFETGLVELVDIPPGRLAVRKFTGFVTEGEVARQKDVLLQNLDLDGWEIDVNHGSIVPHLVFQYNPPYTIPVIRRNEIAVPIRMNNSPSSTSSAEEPNPPLEQEWNVDNGGSDDSSPSDVE